MPTVRVLPPGNLPLGATVTLGDGVSYPGGEPGATPVPKQGRTYSAAPGQVLDVPDFDAAALRAQGWIAVTFGLPARIQGGIGPTAQRPSPAWPEAHYFDTTLGKLAVFDGVNWRDPSNGNSI
jgi:hypothetical protein